MADQINSLSLNEIKSKLLGYYGTESFFHNLNKQSVYTDGAKELFTLASCYWLYDIIQYEIFDILRSKNQVDVFNLKVTSLDSVGTVVLTDYSGEVIFNKPIPFTSFPEGEYSLVIGWEGSRLTTCLISEK